MINFFGANVVKICEDGGRKAAISCYIAIPSREECRSAKFFITLFALLLTDVFMLTLTYGLDHVLGYMNGVRAAPFSDV